MPPRDAARPTGSVAEYASTGDQHVDWPPCACGAPATAVVQARVLNGLAILVVPVCESDIPKDSAVADRIVVATLIALVQVVNGASVGSGARGKRRVRRG